MAAPAPNACSSQRAFEIPEEYRDQLEYVELKDTRSDEEILQSVAQFRPVTSEKNIWAFWHAGLLNMPSWCQRNVVDWVRICESTGWTVRVLDNTPESPSYALKYVSAESMPDAFVNLSMNGQHVGPHSADFLRGACLYEHGGVFIDVGYILTLPLDDICWNELADDESPYGIAIPLMYALVVANHFVAARKGDPFIKRW